MRTVMALSGGMDSTSLLLHLLTQNCKITCISFNYGQKHVIEIEKAKANIRYLNELNFQIEHIVIDITDCMNSLYSALTDSEVDVPEGHYEEEQMKKRTQDKKVRLRHSHRAARRLRGADQQRRGAAALHPRPRKRKRGAPAGAHIQQRQQTIAAGNERN